MPLPWCPTFEYGEDEVCALSYPMSPPTPASLGVGGVEDSAAGVPTSFLVRRDYTVTLPLIFRDAEWPDVLAMLEYAQGSGAVVTITPTAGGDSYPSYLISPRMGEDVAPTRAQAFGYYTLTTKWRSASGTPYDLRYWG